jgi:uncharacterized protein with PIN domain
MAIKPVCDQCGEELQDYGAIVLSPPNEKSEVHKFHLCKSCYEKLEFVSVAS